jgi:hypothetical protein
MDRDYGTVTFEGKVYTLTQYAYIDNYRDDVCYYAHAIDDEGEDYKIRWDILDSFDSLNDEDESNACDWQNPVAVYEC